MKRYCVVEQNFKENHAGSKARSDAARILEKSGWIPLSVHHSEKKGNADKIKMSVVTLLDWCRISFCTAAHSKLLIQYPLAMYPKVSTLAIPFLKFMKKRKGIRLIFLIHDLDSLRGLFQQGERRFLSLADTMIAHNEKMMDYLRKEGYSCQEIRPLGIFDYLAETDGQLSRKEGEKNCLVIAGNLSREKAGYVYRLKELEGGVRFLLFGPNYDGEADTGHVSYQGQYPPDELPSRLNGGFGLVWDGEKTDTCSGAYGRYMRFNNPHKASLYLASGLPLVIWKQSALADFVTDRGVGIAVDSIQEGVRQITLMSDRQYLDMKKNAEELGAVLRNGRMLEQAVKDL